jgi:hypothetical protein
VFEPDIAVAEAGGNEVALFPYRYFDDNGKPLSSGISILSVDVTSKYPAITFQDTSRVIALAAAKDYLAVLTADNMLYRGHLGDESLVPLQVDAKTTGSLLLVDLDRDDSYETILTGNRGILIFSAGGSFERIIVPDELVGSPVTSDIDSDGYPEVIQCTESRIWAFRTGGAYAKGFPYSLPPGDDTETITSPPIIADFNNDGRLDIACVTSDKRIVSFDESGRQTTGFPRTVSGSIEFSPCLFKSGSAGLSAIAFCTTDGKIIAIDLMTPVKNTVNTWPMWKGGPGLTSAFLNSSIPSIPKTTARFEAYCYPNPITGSTGTFRIIPQGPTDCTITVYTVDGQKVFEHYMSQDDIIPGVPNEMKMNTNNLSSGLYIAKIKTRQKTMLYKLGVLK